MFSVTDVVEQLRRAHASAGAARRAALHAEALIEAGSEIFDAATRTSIWPQVEQLRQLGRDASDDVRAAAAELLRAQEVIEEYCVSIAGYGIAGADTSGIDTAEPADPVHYADLGGAAGASRNGSQIGSRLA